MRSRARVGCWRARVKSRARVAAGERAHEEPSEGGCWRARARGAERGWLLESARTRSRASVAAGERAH